MALQLNPAMNANLAMPETVKMVAPIGLAGLIIAGMISIVPIIAMFDFVRENLK